MTVIREPVLHAVDIADLRPTQVTVGLHEVEQKRREWRHKGAGKGSQYLAHHLIPVVIGPKGRPYVIDHHHMARALHEEGQEKVFTTIVADLARLGRDEFWFAMDCREWVHPFDADGVRCSIRDIPKTIDALVDDPFRSLAGELRRFGGFAKDTAPFSEFVWADFLRRRMKRKDVETDFTAALEHAMALAKAADADHLPGWCGPVVG